MKQQLIDYIKAGFPLMGLPTVEVPKAVAQIRETVDQWNQDLKESTASEVLKQYGYQMREWTVSRGWYKSSDPDKKMLEKNTDDPLKAMSWLLDEKDKREVPAAVYVVHNFQFFFEDQMMRPLIVDYLTQFAEARTPHRHVIFVGNYASLPAEISHLFMTLDFPLPGREDLINIRSVITRILGAS